MRILFVARRYWPAVGGVEAFLRHMATELGTRHDLTVLAARIDDGPHTRLNDSLHPPPSFEPFQDGAVTVRPLRVPLHRRAGMAPLFAHITPGLRRYAYGRSRTVAAALVAQATAPVIAAHARGADVIHMWAGDLLASAAVRAGELAGVPVVITPFAHEGQWGYDGASIRAYRRAAGTLALLSSEAGFYGRLGVDPARIEVAGVCSPGLPHIDRAEARARLGVSGPLVVFLGVRRAYKGFDLLLEAAPKVSAMHSDASFAFLGPGPRLEDPPSGCRVLDVGLVSEEEKALWLHAADVMCLPSQAEILPVSILEAWSAGTPVLTSDIATLAELVGRSGGGRCCAREAGAIGDCLIEMLGDPGGLRRMGDAGKRVWTERYTPAQVARRHEDVYLRARAGADRHATTVAA